MTNFYYVIRSPLAQATAPHVLTPYVFDKTHVGGRFLLVQHLSNLKFRKRALQNFPNARFQLYFMYRNLKFPLRALQNFATPAFRKKAVKAGVTKVSQRPLSKFKLLLDIDPTGAGPKGCTRPVFVTFELNTRQRHG